MRPRTLAVVLALVLAAPRVAADPSSTPKYARLPLLTLSEPRTVCRPAELAGDPPVCRALPPGRFLDEPAYQAVHTELERLQTAEVRLGAENASLRKSAEGWSPGWRTLAITFVTGVVGGVAVYRYLDR